MNPSLTLLLHTLLLIGGLNLLIQGFFKYNPLEQLSYHVFDNEYLEHAIYIIIGLSALYLLFNRNYYLPFLGPTVLPPSSFQYYKNPSHTQEIPLDIKCPKAVKIVYWGAKADKSGTVYESPSDAYDTYENYGVSPVINGKSILYIQYPSSYKVSKFLSTQQLDKHIHYRIIGSDGWLSEVKTIFI